MPDTLRLEQLADPLSPEGHAMSGGPDPANEPDYLFAPRAMTRVYRLPARMTDGYCFGGEKPITFFNVDWFETPLTFSRKKIEAEIKRKRYFDPTLRYLVIIDSPDRTFTIEPNGDTQ